jgi:hypothetical protein
MCFRGQPVSASLGCPAPRGVAAERMVRTAGCADTSRTNSVASRASGLSGIGTPAMMLRMALTQARGCGRRWWPAIDSPTPLIGLRDHAHLVAPTMVGIDCTDCRRPGVAQADRRPHRRRQRRCPIVPCQRRCLRPLAGRGHHAGRPGPLITDTNAFAGPGQDHDHIGDVLLAAGVETSSVCFLRWPRSTAR